MNNNLENDRKTKLTILTPEGVFFDDYVDLITVKLTTGYRGIQKNILPFVSNIEISTMYLNFPNSPDYQILAIGGGLIYAERLYVNIFTDDVSFKEDLDESNLNSLLTITKQNLESSSLDFANQTKQETILKKTINKLNTIKLK
ncbi:MAG: FoF1 ATP synthase subunit delta/epsilon [Metamycoplasmataceae bacterium]